jgi:hypothetical protein
MLEVSTNQNGTGSEGIDSAMARRLRFIALFILLALVLFFFGPRLWLLGAAGVAAVGRVVQRKRGEIKQLQQKQREQPTAPAGAPRPSVFAATASKSM